MEDRRDRRLDTWIETGRQFVDGVSGRRPGQRRSGFDLDSVGRWVGDKVEWLLEEDDNWREPWQESARVSRGGKRPLDAISRRSHRRGVSSAPSTEPRPISQAPLMPERDSPTPPMDDWPEDDSFRIDRWQRPRDGGPLADGSGNGGPVEPSARRSLPRSSRRRD